ncbi:MAG: hypothetical protein GY866_01860 [Proteobacteria bacterium]|nr:hypothetical protein [Pseudomonadota bacterium]
MLYAAEESAKATTRAGLSEVGETGTQMPAAACPDRATMPKEAIEAERLEADLQAKEPSEAVLEKPVRANRPTTAAGGGGREPTIINQPRRNRWMKRIKRTRNRFSVDTAQKKRVLKAI